MEDKDKYLILGTGSGTEVFLSNSDKEDLDSILGFVDNDKEKQGTLFKGKKVYSLEEIKNLDYKKIIISSLFYNEIQNRLLDFGIEKEKITGSIRNFTCSNLKQFIFLEKQIHLLKNKKFSIISNYCWGLFMYRFFDIEYQTPFIGSYIYQYQYMLLLNDLKSYLNQPPEISLHPHGFCQLKLKDVTIFFFHEKEPERLLKKWERRLERLDMKNLFIHSGTTEFEPTIFHLAEQLTANFDYKLNVFSDNSFLSSRDKKIITTNEPLDLVKWFNKEL